VSATGRQYRNSSDAYTNKIELHTGTALLFSKAIELLLEEEMMKFFSNLVQRQLNEIFMYILNRMSRKCLNCDLW
jgi:nitrate reductase beta subunit